MRKTEGFNTFSENQEIQEYYKIANSNRSSKDTDRKIKDASLQA